MSETVRPCSSGPSRSSTCTELYPELGVNGHSPNATLGQALDHIDNPHFNGPPPGRSTGAMLDRSIHELFADTPTLDRVLKAMTLEQGISYIEALEKLQESSVMARSGTVRELFQWASVNAPDDLAEDVKLLERAATEAEAAYQHDTRKLTQEQTNAMGMVLLDSGAGGRSADVGAMIGDPAEFERRFHRARRAAPHMYEAGAPGRERFREDDRLHLDSGLDLVRTLERGNELQAAGARRAQLTRQLEQTLTGTADKRARMRMLDGEIAKLREERDRIAPHAPTLDPESGQLRTLDQHEKSYTEQIDEPELQLQIIDRKRELGESYEDARRHVLEAAHAAAPSPGDTPAGPYDPGSRRLDQRVRERLRLLDRPEGDYQRTLEEIFTEDRDADMGLSRRGPLFPVSDGMRKP